MLDGVANDSALPEDLDVGYGVLRSLRPGAYGRGLERLLPADLWSELAATYVGTEIEENWNALFRTTALFRRVATEVAEALGYAYPQDVDDAISAQLEEVRRLPPWTTSSTVPGTPGALC